MVINSPCLTDKKESAIPGKTTTGKSKEVGTLRYLSLVVPLTKVGDEAVHKELGDRIERVASTASSFKTEQDSGYTLGSGEDSMQQMELMEFVQNCVTCTASAIPEVSTAAEGLVYIRRNENKKKDKGKAIMIEDEFVQKKSKKQMQEERLGHEEAIRLQEQIDEGERKRIARDAEIAKQLKICLRILTGMI
ncbi:hypothetical protein Tco_0640143 [Tanacetum coccineum]